MKVEFFKERSVSCDKVALVIHILNKLSLNAIEFDDTYTELDVIEDLGTWRPFHPNKQPADWYEKHFAAIHRKRNSKIDRTVKIFFHDNNEFRWYSLIGFPEDPDYKYITIPTADHIWLDLPNKEFAIVHEILSSILISQAVKNEKEYYRLTREYTTGSLIDPLWVEKGVRYDIDNGEFIRQQDIVEGSKMLQLKIELARFDNNLLNALRTRGVDESLIRDVRMALVKIADSNSNAGRNNLDTVLPFDILVEIINDEIKNEYNIIIGEKEVHLSPASFAVFCTYLIYKKKLMQKRNTKDTDYEVLWSNDTVTIMAKIYELVKTNRRRTNLTPNVLWQQKRMNNEKFKSFHNGVNDEIKRAFDGRKDYSKFYEINKDGLFVSDVLRFKVLELEQEFSSINGKKPQNGLCSLVKSKIEDILDMILDFPFSYTDKIFIYHYLLEIKHYLSNPDNENNKIKAYKNCKLAVNKLNAIASNLDFNVTFNYDANRLLGRILDEYPNTKLRSDVLELEY